MKTPWQIEDLIDLEYFLHRMARDEAMDSPSASARDRDRELYLQRILPQLPEGQPYSRREILRLWLEARRQRESEETGRQAMLPGELFAQVWRLSVGGLMVGGIVAGSWLAASLLRYHGTEPVNVSLYIALLVVMQACLAVISTLFLLLRRFHWRVPRGLLYHLLRSLVTTLMGWLGKRVGERVSGDRRAEFEAALGLIKGRGQGYGSLFFWPFFVLVQTFGVGFNLGGLASTGLRVVGTDLAFGWQSTLQLSAGAVHRLVEGISAPWSWILSPEIAAPTLAQIEGSRIILKDGIYLLATADLVAWWPFLLFSLCFYGLLPRLLLLSLGAEVQRRLLARLEFNNSSCDRLLQHLDRPSLRLDGTVTPALADQAAGNVVSPPAVILSSSSTRSLPGVALIPDDIFDDCPLARLSVLAQQVFGVEVVTSFRIGQGLAADHQGIRRLVGDAGGVEPKSIFILQEAWHPPIRETLTFLQELRTNLGTQLRIGVGLIGKPAGGTIFTPVDPLDWQTWQRKITGLGDPNLRLERLVKDNERHDP